MPVFEYKGYSQTGKKVAGVVDADNVKSARVKLRRQGIMSTNVDYDTTAREIQRAPLSSLFNRITVKDISDFTRQLATLQGAGLRLVESLDALIDQAVNERFRKVITNVREQVSSGSSLAGAMESHPSCFDPMYVNLVRAGEASGSLGQTLNKLALFGENRLRRKTKVTAAMVYPVIMTIVGSGVLMFLLGYVVPKTRSMFEDMEQALPLPTVILLWISDFMANWWWAILVGLAVIGWLVYRYISTDNGRKRLDRLSLKIPIFGPIVQNAAIARFAGSLGVLLAGGVELIEALRITEKAVGNTAIAEAIDNAITNITEGEAIADPLRKSGLFPPVVTQMISAGERSGSLDQMLEKITESYDFEVESSLSALTSLVEPLLILVMGAVTGFIVMAILLPIFELSQIVQ
ncbi:MAG TPA: type II secretion system protein GspF [Nitrospirae bacterium]|nr:type II secretion system protein GspF [Nitrospirota bacterium]